MKQKKQKQPPRVFVVQQPRPRPSDGWLPDFSTALKYGGLRFVFSMDERAHLDPEQASKKVEETMIDFDPENDFVLPTIFGDPATTWVTLCWLSGLVAEKGFEHLNFLYWNRGKGEDGMTDSNGYYAPVRISL